jgi:hypothetical protein
LILRQVETAVAVPDGFLHLHHGAGKSLGSITGSVEQVKCQALGILLSYTGKSFEFRDEEFDGGRVTHDA